MIKRFKLKSLNQEGSFLAAVLIITMVLIAIGISLSEVVVTRYASTNKSISVANALLTAEAGVERSIQALNDDESFTGFDSAQEFFNNETQGKSEFTSTITEGPGGSSKVITATGKVYVNASSANPASTQSVRVTIVGTESDGYSVQTGPGGLILKGSANITNADVFVNGTISMTGNAKIGTASQPLSVQVANQACPPGNSPGASYPQVCGSGNQPISLAQSTKIFGTVCATGQTSTGPNNNITGGSNGQGLVVGCTAPPISQPAFDRQAFINQMTTTGSATSNTYVCQSWPFDRTWPANLRLNGDVSINGSCNIVLSGDVYITGNLTINGAAKVTVANSAGTNRPRIVTDGKIQVNGSGGLLANTSGTGMHFISMSSNAACGSACTDLTGNALKLTQDYETVSVGGGVNLAGMIFQAYWGKVTLGGSGNVGAAVGQTVEMSGSGTVTFGTKLASGSKIWTVTSYQQIYQ